MADEARSSTPWAATRWVEVLYEIMWSPAVSRALTYKEVCFAARNEEKRLETPAV